MSRFYKFGDSDQCINLDHVRSYTVRREKKPDYLGRQVYHIFIRYADGESETLTVNYDPNPGLDNLSTPVVPANPGFEHLSVWYNDEVEPIAANVSITRSPVVAWRIGYGDEPDPVVLDKCNIDSDSGLTAILQPDGAVFMHDDLTAFDSLDKWIEHVCYNWREWYNAKREKEKIKGSAPHD